MNWGKKRKNSGRDQRSVEQLYFFSEKKIS